MGSQRFGVPKTEYVCHFFFDIALTIGSQRFLFDKTRLMAGFRLRELDVVWLGLASLGFAWLGSGLGNHLPNALESR